MCGIAGIISSYESDINIPLLKRLSNTLEHRGPDGGGMWINPKKTAGLAHRRLAILDLSFEAVQPMHYRDRYSIVHNGEIYNYLELKQDLQKFGYHFKSNTDTEVILAAYDYYKERCVHYFDGMFSFAIWDEADQCLFAARDRFGEKPFYYYKDKTRFIFASEMKAIWTAGVEKSVEEKMVLNYLTLGIVQNPSDKSQTFYNKILSLPPAHFLTLHKNELTTEKYWDIDKNYCTTISESEAIEKLDYLLSVSVSRRLRCDVPFGTSLSGGLDSSTLLHFIKKNSAVSFETFSATFPGFEKDEKIHIDKMAKHFQLDNFKVTPNEIDLITDFDKLIYHQEEPFTSSSVYAQYRVFKLASEQNVKVLLDGQGADEVFGGYHKYLHWFLQEKINKWQFKDFIQERKNFKKNNIPVKWGMKNIVATYLPPHVSIGLEKRAYNQILSHPDLSNNMISTMQGREWEGIHKPIVTKLNDILYFDVMEMGLEELLRYSDRNAMANGCEVRLPFLNADLVSFVFSLPSSFKIKNGFTKSILRKLMNNRLPHEIVWRKDKIGYEPPQKKWMESDIMKDYLFEAKRSLVDRDILKPQVLEKKPHPLDAHDANNFDWRYLCVAGMIKKA